MRTPYEKEIVTRSAPRWAWDVIDETLELDTSSATFDPALRAEISNALQAMIDACENPED